MGDTIGRVVQFIAYGTPGPSRRERRKARAKFRRKYKRALRGSGIKIRWYQGEVRLAT